MKRIFDTLLDALKRVLGALFALALLATSAMAQAIGGNASLSVRR